MTVIKHFFLYFINRAWGRIRNNRSVYNTYFSEMFFFFKHNYSRKDFNMEFYYFYYFRFCWWWFWWWRTCCSSRCCEKRFVVSIYLLSFFSFFFLIFDVFNDYYFIENILFMRIFHQILRLLFCFKFSWFLLNL